MPTVNTRRIVLGALVGGLVWNVWSLVVNVTVLGPRYPSAQQAGYLLQEPRYPFFTAVWVLTLFVLAGLLAWLYAGLRATYGPGPRTAFKVGVVGGFAAGFPTNFAMTTWAPFDRVFPLWWTLELWVGAILATLAAGWLYRDS